MFNQDYSDLLREFAAHNVEYVVVGAYAMAAHGYVRSTGDIDILVKPTLSNSEAAYISLRAFGAPLTDVTKEDFAALGTVYQIGVPPNRIDILTAIDGVSYEELGRVWIEIEGREIPFLDLTSLKRNKAATGRTKDKLDLELMSGDEAP